MIPDPDVQRQLILQEREKSRSRRAMAEAVAKETRERHRDNGKGICKDHIADSIVLRKVSQKHSKATKNQLQYIIVYPAILLHCFHILPPGKLADEGREDWTDQGAEWICPDFLSWIHRTSLNLWATWILSNDHPTIQHLSAFVSQFVFFSPFSSHHSVRSTRMTGRVFQDRQTTEEPAETEEVDYSDYSSKEKKERTTEGHRR